VIVDVKYGLQFAQGVSQLTLVHSVVPRFSSPRPDRAGVRDLVLDFRQALVAAPAVIPKDVGCRNKRSDDSRQH
jgi:hypothetical protein